ncbi:MAG: hypothetical protein CVU56_14880 [Deltaproteobacteria bacterium HGW-Deltaproteobacteria-14]|jgi:hypothetical protein|nr:MAG: hypothetical protein CVU56_14880 [Deltaproteobacteria bacterium HGW-Deltaproteobacteria-14]
MSRTSVQLYATLAAALAVAVGAAVVGGGCAVDNPPEALPEPSFEYFACAVQPVLDRECSNSACHGNVARGLQILSPSRMRIASEYALARLAISEDDVESGIHPPLTGVEVSFNYEQCRGWATAVTPNRPAPLLDKPLAVSAGGVYHTTHGDVFASPDEPGFQAIAAWLRGATAAECP